MFASSLFPPRAPTIGAQSTDNESSLFSGYEYDEEFELLVNAFLRDMNYTTLSQAALNIAYATINVGIVALPFIAQESGIALFVVVMILGALVSGYTSVMVISMANQQRVRTLEDLAERAFGLRGFFAVSGFQICYSFCLMCVTLGVWADIMSDTFISLDIPAPLLRTRGGMVIAGGLLIFPLCLLKRSMSSMKWTSYVTVLAVMAALIAVMATYFKDRESINKFFVHTSAQDLFRPKLEWFTVVFLSAFVYSANQKVLTIYSSLRRRTAERWQTAVTRAYTGVTVLYVLFAVAGYLAKSRENVRLDTFNFFIDASDEDRVIFDPARIMLAFSLLLTIPGDSLVATTTWRRARSKYIRAYHPTWDTGRAGVSHNYQSLRADVDRETLQHGKEDERTGLLYGEDRDSGGSLTGIVGRESGNSERERDKDVEANGVVRRHSHSSLSPSPVPVSVPPTIQSKALPVNVSNTLSLAPSPRGNDDKAKVSPETSQRLTHAHTHHQVIRERERETDSMSASDSGFSEDARLAANNATLSTLHSVTQNARTSQGGNPIGLEDYELDLPVPHYDYHFNREAPRSVYSRSKESSYSGLGGGGTGSGGASGSSGGLRRMNTPEAVQARLASVDDLLVDTDAADALHSSRYCPTIDEAVPTLVNWILCVGVALLINHWLYLVSTFGTISIVALMFFFPSMLYFRLGLLSDFQARPIYGSLVPNRLFMNLVRFTGVAVLVFDISACICFVVTRANIARKDG